MTLGITLVFLLSSLGFATIEAPPVPPNNFYGIVTEASGGTVPLNAEVLAEVDGVTYVATVTYDLSGSVAYDFNVPGEEGSENPEKEGADSGETVFFWVDGNICNQVGTWSSGAATQLDLVYDENAQPTLPVLNELMIEPVSGEEWIELYNPSSSALSLADYSLADNDGFTLALTGSVPANGFLKIDLGATAVLENDAQDELKLLWTDPAGTLAAGNAVVIDRVEYGPQGSAPDDTSGYNGELSNAVIPPAGQSLALDPDGDDNDDPAGDYVAKQPTPGYSNAVTNTDPTLSAGTVSPTSGTVDTTFVYSVTYSDADDDAPTFVEVVVDGNAYTMTETDFSDTDYTDGKEYEYSTTLGVGSHTYSFGASDGLSSVETAESSGPSVTGENTAPTLTTPSVDPSTGDEDTLFRYSVTYTDADNNAPTSIQVDIDGTAYSMGETDSADTDYTDGKEYEYETRLSTGSHTYRFLASDGTDEVETSEYSGPTVSGPNNAPTLTGGTVSPSSGSSTTLFTYTVIYTDMDDDAPAYVYVTIGGVSNVMSESDPLDTTYTDGKSYDHSTTLSEGSHTYSFMASDGIEEVSTTTLSGPTVTAANAAPTLTSGAVSPTSGTVDDLFTYTVVYTDADNDAPAYVRVDIDGTTHSMSASNTGDTDHSNGKAYEYSTTLDAGSHTYRFRASDGTDSVSTPLSTGPDVSDFNTAPTLSNGEVTPLYGTPTTQFVFTVVYTDADDDAPVGSGYIRVHIDDAASGTLMSKDTSAPITLRDNDHTNGERYRYQTSFTGETHRHSFSFSCSDGEDTAELSPTEELVVNTVPTLSGSVSPTAGTTETDFNFTVTYTDADNDAPDYVRLVLNDGAPLSMVPVDPADTTASNGIVYYHRTQLANRSGGHTYYFTASDGLNETATASTSGPAVTDAVDEEPTLTDPAVEPTSGDEDRGTASRSARGS